MLVHTRWKKGAWLDYVTKYGMDTQKYMIPTVKSKKKSTRPSLPLRACEQMLSAGTGINFFLGGEFFFSFSSAAHLLRRKCGEKQK